MQFGMLSRNGRSGRIAAESWAEDLWDVVVADRLGFQEAWISEHLGRPAPDSLPSADLFICRAAGMTKRIRFGPGIRAVPYFHPVMVAIEAATTDHLTGGRYMAGFGGAGGAAGPGGPSFFSQLGLDRETADKRAMMHEAIDLILKCWAEPEPFDFHGKFWQGKGILVQPKPFQQPRMPVGMAVSETDSTANLAGAKGFFPLHSAYDGPEHLRRLDETFFTSAQAAGRNPSRKDIRILRIVHVSDSVKKAKEEIRPWALPVIEPIKAGIKSNPVKLQRQLPAGMAIDDVDLDWLIDSGLFLVGDPDTVYQKAKDLYDQVGGFGVLLFNVGTGSSNGPRRLRRRSWQLFMQHVAPRLAALDPDAQALRAS